MCLDKYNAKAWISAGNHSRRLMQCSCWSEVASYKPWEYNYALACQIGYKVLCDQLHFFCSIDCFLKVLINIYKMILISIRALECFVKMLNIVNFKGRKKVHKVWCVILIIKESLFTEWSKFILHVLTSVTSQFWKEAKVLKFRP